MSITDQVVVNAINLVLQKKLSPARKKINDYLQGTVRAYPLSVLALTAVVVLTELHVVRGFTPLSRASQSKL